MVPYKTVITPENSASWLASCGFIFPTNEAELARFDTLHGGISPLVTGEEVDPFKILRKSAAEKKPAMVRTIRRQQKSRLVAQQLKALRPDIAKKWKKDNG